MIRIGKTLGNFLIKEEIGKGGMGTIYFAIDTMLNREVALKVIHSQYTNNAQLMERFKIEAMTQAQMHHPNIVMIFSFSKIDKEYVIAMEYVKGKSLKEILNEKKRLNITESLHYLKQILTGLKYAHSSRVIHRDIKPANIMVAGDKMIKLSDFGIAKVFGTQGLTKTGMLLGTPWYTSPEQILGKGIDFRADLYSTGITFYEMLTGKVPFDSETNSEFQIQRAHLETPPPRPSIYNQEIGIKLEKFILKSLQKKPEKRFQSSVEMFKELIKLENEVVKATMVAGADKKTEVEEIVYQDRKKIFSFFKAVTFSLVAALAVILIVVFSNKSGGDPDNNEISKKNMLIEKNGQTDDKELPSLSEDKKSPGDVKVKSNMIKDGIDKNGQQISDKKQVDKTGISDKQEVKPEVKPETKPSTKKHTTQSTKTKDFLHIETELIKIRNLVKNGNFKKADELAVKLAITDSSPKVNSAVGNLKLFLSQFREAEKYWNKAIAANGEVRILFYQKRGLLRKGYRGNIVLKKGLLIYNCLSKPEKSFALTSDKIESIKKVENAPGIEIIGNLIGEKKKLLFSLVQKRNRRRCEEFIADFINKYIIIKK